MALLSSCTANDTGGDVKHEPDLRQESNQETNKNIENDLKQNIAEKIGVVENDTVENDAVDNDTADYREINTQEAMLGLKEITREEAGLKDVKFLESNKINLNESIYKLYSLGLQRANNL